MAYSLLAHALGANGGTGTATATLNTTGAALLIAVTTGQGVPGVSDNKGNTWALVKRTTWNSSHCDIWQTTTTLFGTGHTVSATASVPGLAVLAFAAGAASAVDQVAGNGASTVSALAAGSVTPTVANEVVIVAGLVSAADFVSIDSGFTLLDHLAGDGATVFGTASAYQIQTTPTTRNPTWTASLTASTLAASIATFKEVPATPTGRMFQVF